MPEQKVKVVICRKMHGKQLKLRLDNDEEIVQVGDTVRFVLKVAKRTLKPNVNSELDLNDWEFKYNNRRFWFEDDNGNSIAVTPVSPREFTYTAPNTSVWFAVFVGPVGGGNPGGALSGGGCIET